MNTLVIFGRAPQPRKGKSRLRAQLDECTVDALQRAFVADTVCWDLPSQTSLLVSLTGSMHELAHIAPEAGVIIQPKRNFGTRLAAAIDGAFARGARRVVVVGTDSPTLPAEAIASCFDNLDDHPAALVPADDGGWVALGVERPVGSALRDVPWSTSETCAATCDALTAARRTPVTLEPWYDVDDLHGLRRLREEVAELKAAARAPRTAAVLKRLP